MEKTIEQTAHRKASLYTYAISAFILTFLVFCLDEGHNNISWTTHMGSWIVFAVYATFVMFGQVLFSYFLLKLKKVKSATFISVVVGGLFGLAMAIAFFLFVLKS